MKRLFISKNIDQYFLEKNRLSEQYFSATGEKINYFSKNSMLDFDNFYDERREIGKSLFQLLEEDYSVMESSSLELGHSLYDSIGILYDTSVLFSDPRLLIDLGYENHLIGSFKRYGYGYQNNIIGNYNKDLDYSKNDINIIGFNPMIDKPGILLPTSIDCSMIDTIILLNARTLTEDEVFRDMFFHYNKAIYGYYGSIYDRDRLEHLYLIENLMRENEIDFINIEDNKKYYYVLKRTI